VRINPRPGTLKGKYVCGWNLAGIMTSTRSITPRMPVITQRVMPNGRIMRRPARK
jgi:hypothetical protein